MEETTVGQGQVPLTTLEKLVARLRELSVSVKEVRATLTKGQEELNPLVQPTTTTLGQVRVKVERALAQVLDTSQLTENLSERFKERDHTNVGNALTKLQEKLGRLRHKLRRLLEQVQPATLGQVQAQVEHVEDGGAQDNDQAMTLDRQENDTGVSQDAMAELVSLLDDLNTGGAIRNKDDA
ncbi:hypothetical protein BGX29_007567 [Mortierella sp. GBA35]|nr:hypothetical protein BGX29_007567 [Mortierella sp. GBA35]KAG0216931.1 hypothetical protein BGX33_011849 [Mortierella sp. NVP41]